MYKTAERLELADKMVTSSRLGTSTTDKLPESVNPGLEKEVRIISNLEDLTKTTPTPELYMPSMYEVSTAKC